MRSMQSIHFVSSLMLDETYLHVAFLTGRISGVGSFPLRNTLSSGSVVSISLNMKPITGRFRDWITLSSLIRSAGVLV